MQKAEPKVPASQRPSSEDRLLVCCADMSDDEKVMGEAQEILSEGVDWHIVIRKARLHRLTPLLYSLLRRMDEGHSPPEAAMTILRRIYRVNALRNVRLENELVTILRRFRQEDLDCIVLKGLFMLKRVYKDAALRPISDIDLLIHFRDLSRAAAVLGELGYQAPPHLLPSGFYRRIHFHEEYHAERSHLTVPLELHWRLQDKFHVLEIDTDEVWQNAIPWEISDTSSLAMCPEDLLAYLCYHADKHGCFSKYLDDLSSCDLDTLTRFHRALGLLWYAEILRLIRLKGSRFDWESFVEKCRAWGIEAEIYTTLTLINSLFGISVATHALDELDPPRVRKQLAKLYLTLLERRDVRTTSSSSLTARLLSRLHDSYSILRFRPTRFLDILTYIFPDLKSVSRRYRASPPSVYLYYAVHVSRASLVTMMHFSVLAYYLGRQYLFSGLKRLYRSPAE